MTILFGDREEVFHRRELLGGGRHGRRLADARAVLLHCGAWTGPT
jgi:hypothetical protein